MKRLIKCSKLLINDLGVPVLQARWYPSLLENCEDQRQDYWLNVLNLLIEWCIYEIYHTEAQYIWFNIFVA